MKKGMLILGASALIMSNTGCIGTFQAFNNLKDWNLEATDNKFVNELIFLGLNIVPVYGIFILGDMIIFNTVEFWTGSNPISLEGDESQEQWIVKEGRNFKITAKKNKFIIREYASGKIVDKALIKYDDKTQTWTATKGSQSLDVLHIDPVSGDITLRPNSDAAYKIPSNTSLVEIKEAIETRNTYSLR